MSTLGIRMTDNLNTRLKEVAAVTHRTKSQVAKIAIESYLKEIELYLDADRRLKDENDETVSYEEFKKEFNF